MIPIYYTILNIRNENPGLANAKCIMQSTAWTSELNKTPSPIRLRWMASFAIPSVSEYHTAKLGEPRSKLAPSTFLWKSSRHTRLENTQPV